MLRFLREKAGRPVEKRRGGSFQVGDHAAKAVYVSVPLVLARHGHNCLSPFETFPQARNVGVENGALFGTEDFHVGYAGLLNATTFSPAAPSQCFAHASMSSRRRASASDRR